MLKHVRTVLCGWVGVSLLTVVAVGQTQQQKPMSDEDKKMMEAMMKAATPGKEHQWLAAKAGTWSVAGKFWMKPGEPPVESKGTADRSLMLGGRVLAEKVNASSMFGGPPFEGYGLTGYDNVGKEFWGTWNDNMGTGVMVSTGKCDDKGSCTFSGKYTDPMTGQTQTMRMVSRDEGTDKEMHEAFQAGPDGKEMKSMELVYTRKK